MRKHRLKWFEDNIGRIIYRWDIQVMVTKSNYKELYRLQEEECILYSNAPKFLISGRKNRTKSLLFHSQQLR